MNMQEILTAELAAFRQRTGKIALDILEIGTIRRTGDEYADGDGWSTLVWARDIQANGGHFTAVDLHTEAADTVLTDNGLRKEAHLVTGYSVDIMGVMLMRGETFDVIFLDSDNDPVLVMDEYFLARRLLTPHGLIIADDVDQGPDDVRKGDRLIPYLTERGQKHRIGTRKTTRFTRDMLFIDF